ncbi:pilus assembly protein TadG-related protein [Asticcacaulis sp. AND118]|uniref:pilus assembly protein TadG-related protein n=1 Tax=Asticcacaulis sp. AND118 TaxID=2840468 RepID=UPI001CFFADAD|nr:pilus assembly protein TadG-related protein [Asticcacaulis sp. AND118]UDF05019.1 pilus assembly protein TadG-related protein [Asticcacaulis sp. AND118]
MFGFIKAQGGQAGITVTLLAVPLMLAVGGAVELTAVSRDKTILQEAADAGALAGAGRLTLATYGQNTSGINSFATQTAYKQLQGIGDSVDVTFTATTDLQKGTVEVRGLAKRKPIFSAITFGTELNILARAENLQRTPLCVLQTKDGGLTVRNTALIKAAGCAIHANHDIIVESGAMIEAERIQATGKVTGITRPQAGEGAMTIPDPFSDMDLKPPYPCLSLPLEIRVLSSQSVTLPPGVHCGLLQVGGSGRVHLLPGEHYFMSKIQLSNVAQLTGDDVVLIFDSDDKIDIADKGEVRLTARKSGKFAGFLIATSRDNTQTFSIKSDRVSQLLGTIYIPNAELEIETAGSVAQDSAWSVIVARTITLRKDPVLVINKNYAGSGVPVPEGVGPNRSAPALTQ